MSLKVVGAGVGRTGTHSLKIALEQLLGGPCHHMLEILGDPTQASGWIDAIEGRPVDWSTMPVGYVSLVDWPGCSFWPELSAANPDALVLLSVRDPESWYRSASNTIFQSFDKVPPELQPWMEAVRKLFGDRFSDRLEDPGAMIDAYERHNWAVRQAIPSTRLLEWEPGDGWDPICDRLGVDVPSEPFPVTNTTDEFRCHGWLDPSPIGFRRSSHRVPTLQAGCLDPAGHSSPPPLDERSGSPGECPFVYLWQRGARGWAPSVRDRLRRWTYRSSPPVDRLFSRNVHLDVTLAFNTCVKLPTRRGQEERRGRPSWMAGGSLRAA